jgi:hypothetical protein
LYKPTAGTQTAWPAAEINVYCLQQGAKICEKFINGSCSLFRTSMEDVEKISIIKKLHNFQ